MEGKTAYVELLINQHRILDPANPSFNSNSQFFSWKVLTVKYKCSLKTKFTTNDIRYGGYRK